MIINRREILRQPAAAAAAVTLTTALGRQAPPAAPADAWIWDCHGHLGGVTGSAEERVHRILPFADRMQIRRLILCENLKRILPPILTAKGIPL
jgi:hypothetical protein